MPPNLSEVIVNMELASYGFHLQPNGDTLLQCG